MEARRLMRKGIMEGHKTPKFPGQVEKFAGLDDKTREEFIDEMTKAGHDTLSMTAQPQFKHEDSEIIKSDKSMNAEKLAAINQIPKIHILKQSPGLSPKQRIEKLR